MQRQRVERVDTILSGPHKSAEQVAVKISGIGACKTDYVALLIDGHRRVPKSNPKVTDVNHLAIIPEHRVLGGISPNRLVADARNAYDLSPVIDRGGGPTGVARNQGELLDFIGCGTPDHRMELKDLPIYTAWVMNTVLGPSHHLTRVVGAGGKAVVAARQGMKSPHRALLPYEPKAGKSFSPGSGKESETAPSFPVRFGSIGLGNSCDDSPIVFHWPRHAAVLVW